MGRYLNISTYRFIQIEDPNYLVHWLNDQLSKTTIKGTILVATEGINIFLSGNEDEIMTFFNNAHEMEVMRDLHLKKSWSDEVAFRFLKIRCKKEIIKMNQCFISEDNADYLLPRDFHRWMMQGHSDDGLPLLILDTRNTFEFEYGHFQNSVHLDISSFSSFPERLHLLNAYKNHAIVALCTGGVRCEKVGPSLRKYGFQKVYQLDGGILNYFELVGGDFFEGNCFVFDSRRCLNTSLEAVG